METTTIAEFYFTEVSSKYPADIICKKCGYRGEVTFYEAFLKGSKQWSNPNYDIIIGTHRELLRYLYLRPKTIICINDVVDSIYCPSCDKTEVEVTEESSFNLHRIKESLECHKV